MNNELVLVVGDCHVSNNQSLDRFRWLGKLIAETRPDHIVLIGDFLTLNSLSAWDRNKRMNMENKRYFLEIDAGREALSLLQHDMTMLRARQKLNKKRLYNPSLVYVVGNHEDRLTRYLETDPTFDGHVSVQKDLHLAEDNWVWVPYRSSHSIRGIDFTHVPHNKAKPITGMDINKKCSDVTINSTVYGHTHEAHFSNHRRHGQNTNQHVLNCGCFFPEDQDEDYCDGRIKNYWRGVMLMDIYDQGMFDISTVSMTSLENNYG